MAAALVLLGIMVLAMAAAASPSTGEAPRWVHVLSALPFFGAAFLLYRLGSLVRRDRSV
jgi:hypothetical protein